MKLIKPIAIVLLTFFLPGFVLFPSPAAAQPKRKSPNLLVDVSAPLVRAMVNRPVDRTDPVTEIILDNPVDGRSRTVGAVRAELIPSPHHAVVDIIFAARVYARTISTRPHVLIHTTSMTTLDARRRVVGDSSGLRSIQGPNCAKTFSNLVDVTSRKEPDYLAIRMNRQGFEKNQAEADAEAAYKAARHAATDLALELTPILAGASQTVGRVAGGFQKAGLSLESLDFSTSAEFLQARMHFASAGKVDPVKLPAIAPGIDLGIRVHESLFNDAGQTLLGGMTFRLDEIDRLYLAATGGFLREGRKKDEVEEALKVFAKLVGQLGGKSIAVTMEKDQPLDVRFADGGFAIEIKVASVTSGKTTYAGMRVKADYGIEDSADGAVLVRKGPIRFLALDDRKLPVQTANLILLRDVVFAEVLKTRMTLNVLVPDTLAKAALLPPRATTRDGWLAVAWTLKGR